MKGLACAPKNDDSLRNNVTWTVGVNEHNKYNILIHRVKIVFIIYGGPVFLPI